MGSSWLRERCEAYKGQVKCGSDEIERLRTKLEAAEKEIERLKVCRGVKEWRRLMEELCQYELDYQEDHARIERLKDLLQRALDQCGGPNEAEIDLGGCLVDEIVAALSQKEGE